MLIVIKINPGTRSRLDFEEVVSNKVSHQLESLKDSPAGAQQVQRYPTSGAYNTSII
jgi:hypothetical protein